MLSLDQNIVLVFNVSMVSHILLGLPNSSPTPSPPKNKSVRILCLSIVILPPQASLFISSLFRIRGDCNHSLEKEKYSSAVMVEVAGPSVMSVHI